jgi:hypothetical protein
MIAVRIVRVTAGPRPGGNDVPGIGRTAVALYHRAVSQDGRNTNIISWAIPVGDAFNHAHTDVGNERIGYAYQVCTVTYIPCLTIAVVDTGLGTPAFGILTGIVCGTLLIPAALSRNYPRSAQYAGGIESQILIGAMGDVAADFGAHLEFAFKVGTLGHAAVISRRTARVQRGTALGDFAQHVVGIVYRANLALRAVLVPITGGIVAQTIVFIGSDIAAVTIGACRGVRGITCLTAVPGEHVTDAYLADAVARSLAGIAEAQASAAGAVVLIDLFVAVVVDPVADFLAGCGAAGALAVG